MDKNQLDTIMESVKHRRNALAHLMKNKFNIGDKVNFEFKRQIVNGIVTSIMRKNIKVQDINDKWRVFNVHPSYLTKGGK
jgi:ribosomal protein S17